MVILIGLPALLSTPGDKANVIIAVPGRATVLLVLLVLLQLAAAVTSPWLAWPVWAAVAVTVLAAVALITEREEMASRAFQRSQEAYDVVGFKRTVKPGVEDIGVSTENTLGSSFCHGGLTGLEDKTVDGAYQMSHSWALDHVPARQAVTGLRRLHRHLKDEGWEITSYSEGEQGNWDLFAKRDDGAERMSFSWYPEREYFTGGADVPCAYDPAWKDGDVGPSGDDRTPPALGPRSGT